MFKPGDRVKLKQKHNWLSKTQAMARAGRGATILKIADHGESVTLEFDTVRPGAKAQVWDINVRDLIPIKNPKPTIPARLPFVD